VNLSHRCTHLQKKEKKRKAGRRRPGSCSYRCAVAENELAPSSGSFSLHRKATACMQLATDLIPRRWTLVWAFRCENILNFVTVVFFYLCQILFNHKLTRVKRFVSRFIGKLCN